MLDYANYARQMRHELHQCPEIGFDLPKTIANGDGVCEIRFVRREK